MFATKTSKISIELSSFNYKIKSSRKEQTFRVKSETHRRKKEMFSYWLNNTNLGIEKLRFVKNNSNLHTVRCRTTAGRCNNIPFEKIKKYMNWNQSLINLWVFKENSPVDRPKFQLKSDLFNFLCNFFTMGDLSLEI